MNENRMPPFTLRETYIDADDSLVRGLTYNLYGEYLCINVSLEASIVF